MSSTHAVGDRTMPGDAPPWREAAGIAVALAALFGGLAWWLGPGSTTDRGRGARIATRGRSADPSAYVGAASCRDCHPGEYAALAGSGHSRTLRPAASIELAAWLDGRTIDDPERPAARFQFALRDGRLIATRTEGDGRSEVPLDFAVGSGKHAVTFVSLDESPPGHPGGLEHRITYFPHAKSLGVTPGQTGPEEPGRTADGFQLPPAVMLDCIACHATRTSAAGAPTLDRSTLIPNVSCERCHGPGRDHVQAARSGETGRALTMPMGGGDPPERQSRLCGRCHRLPEMVPPGTVVPENRALARFPSVGMLESLCAKKSGTMTCSTCHEPHGRASNDAELYEAACLCCHGQAPESKPCPNSPRSGCVGCHMPRRDVGHGLQFTDHWIRARPEP